MSSISSTFRGEKRSAATVAISRSPYSMRIDQAKGYCAKQLTGPVWNGAQSRAGRWRGELAVTQRLYQYGRGIGSAAAQVPRDTVIGAARESDASYDG